MPDPSRTNQELIKENTLLKQRIQDLDQSKSDLKRAEEANRNAEAHYHALFMQSPNGILLLNPETGKTIEANETAYKHLGYTREEFAALRISDYEASETPEETAKHIQKVIHDGGDDFETLHRTKSGEIRNVHVWTKTIQLSNRIFIYTIFQDITERKRVEEELRESEGKYRSILENIEDGYFEVDLAGNLTFCNDSVLRILGNTRAELMGMNSRQYTDKENSKILYQAFNKVFRTGEPSKGVDHRIIRKDGTKLDIESSVTLIRNTSGQPIGFRGIMRNITERKRAEEAIVVAKNDWENTFDNVPDMITIHNEDFNIVRANAAARTMFSLQQQEGMPLAKCFRCYHGTEHPPTGCASCQSLQTGKPSTVEIFEPFLNKHLEIRAMPRFGSDGRSVGLIHVVRDISERKKAEEQLLHTLDSLRKAVSTTIQVMVSAVEARDPYTAGHQIRSADLARAIATELGIPQERIDSIRMAGLIHDIGKISIPAEILSKPIKLSDIEFSLIKEHANKGFEMLKAVESPWPLAEIVHQHHERTNGSGYPRHLKGEEILMEARILAVADVVESMASHRPYRGALGIDAALNEIENNRGILYDDAAVGACLRLFREKHFQLSVS